MNTQHTPGPWNTGTVNVGDPAKGLYDRTIHDSAGYAIAVAIEDDQSANARLIAAAPELLEALELVKRVLSDDNVRVQTDSIPGDALVIGMYGSVDAAIAKAKGE